MSKTAIIVGAGASHEFNLPVGEGLKKKISDLCQTSSQGRNQSIANSNFEDSLQRIVRSAFEPKTYTQADLVRAAYDISTNMPLAPSIDNFLHTKSENPLVVLTGKLAIAHCIHQAERDSLLNTTTSSEYEPLDFWRVEKTWILKLFKILAAQSNFEQFIEKLNNVEFISFNYDRCIKQFFIQSTKQYFNLDQQNLNKLEKSLNITYVYGHIGNLDFHDFGIYDFGRDPNLLYQRSEALEIQTFTESIHQRTKYLIHEKLDSCSHHIFLGFGFLDINMDILFGKNAIKTEGVFATTFGLSQSNISDIKSSLSDKFYAIDSHDSGGMIDLPESQIVLRDCECYKFFEIHDRILSRIITSS